MLRIDFIYKDDFTRGNWSKGGGVFETVEDCISFFGLGKDCEYEIVSVTEVN